MVMTIVDCGCRISAGAVEPFFHIDEEEDWFGAIYQELLVNGFLRVDHL